MAERTKKRRQKFDEENKKGQGLKILTPDQMLSRLPISLAQLKAGNNSEKLKNEIFMNTENKKANESNKVSYELTAKLNLKSPN